MIFSVIVFAILGLAVGSFLNAAVYRVGTKNGSLTRGRSRCPHCKHQLAARDLVPVVSFAVAGGRCRYCKKKISLQYPIVELSTAAIYALYGAVALSSSAPLDDSVFGIASVMADVVVIGLLLFIGLYDTVHGLILNKVVLVFAAVALIAAALRGVILTDILLGAAVAFAFFGMLYFASAGKWIGAGDVKLGPFLGALVGWPGVLVMLFVAYVGGAILSVILIATKRKKPKERLPFAGFLAAGTLITMLYGEHILRWYIGIIAG